MNNLNFYRTVQFISLILVQVLILNNVNFLGYINPYVYVLFILLYPIKNNRSVFLLISFAMGLLVDMFSDSGGINAAACVTIAFIRPVILKFAFGMVYEYQTLKFKNTEIGNRLIYFSIMIFVHHLVMFSLEVFNIMDILLILKKTLFSCIFSVIICALTMVIFSRKER